VIYFRSFEFGFVLKIEKDLEIVGFFLRLDKFGVHRKTAFLNGEDEVSGEL
jgi:hypothetical protein